MPWHLLGLSGCLCIVGAWFSYSDHRFVWWFPYLMAWLGAAMSLVWAQACWEVKDKVALYAFSVWWDVVTVSSYYGIPLLLSDVQPRAGVLVGVFFVAAGVVLVTVYS